MMKSLIFQQQQNQQQQQVVVVEENMSNLTSASNEGNNSVSSGTRTEIGTFMTPPPTSSDTSTQPPSKKKRNLPGNPDPDAEVIALSPKSLLATNRFMCEICNKGFQRDQNLQLHRRGHNLPWKLKQRTSKEIRKKVYVCPEPSCVHHDPSRALGDLTGIKKHFCRKHGEKKWKCEKCSKKYAVQSDWKAHSKTCGTREYRCDCGTLFSRRDSFITHRAFCDALAQETARTTTTTSTTTIPQLHHQFNNPQIFPLKKEPLQLHHQSFNLVRTELPPWLGSSSSSSNTPTPSQNNHQGQDFLNLHENNENPNPNPNPNPRLVGVGGPTIEGYPSAHMSATALLQKAAQMGATMSSSIGPHHQSHVSVNPSATLNHFPLNLSSRDHHHHNHNHITTTTTTTTTTTAAPSSSSSLLHDVMMMNSFSSGFEAAQFDDPFGGILVSNNNITKKDGDDNGNGNGNDGNNNNNFLLHDTLPKATTTTANDRGGGRGGGAKEELTRDFLGLRPLSHSDILNIAAMGNCMNDQQNLPQKHW
ncbi:hypothetical protein AAHE18_19G053900 [Arachis hypogaea]